MTVNAVSMHANMLKDEIIINIRKLLNEKFIHVNDSFPIEQLMQALTIILENNVFAFGDTYWKQHRGIAMGTPVACAVATLFFAYQEIKHLLPKFTKQIMLYLRCIDNGLMLWKVDSNESSSCVAFEHYITEINKCSCLSWTASLLSITVNYLDLTLTITTNHHLIASPYAKPFHIQHCAPHLLSFAAQLEPSTSAFFPFYAPTNLPVLETLHKCFHGPIRPLPVPPAPSNTLFFHAACHLRDISRLTIRRLHEKHCKEIFKEDANIDEFVA